MLAGIAAQPDRFLIEPAELLLADIAVIALQLLLGHQLGAEIGRLLAPLAVLAGTVFAAVDRALRPAPEIDAEAPVDLVLGTLTLAHWSSFWKSCLYCPDRSGRRATGRGHGDLSARRP